MGRFRAMLDAEMQSAPGHSPAPPLRRLLAAVLVAGLVPVSQAHAQDVPALADAEADLARSLPALAVVRLQAIPVQGLSPADQQRRALLLAAAQLQAGNAAGAAEALAAIPSNPQNAGELLLRSQVMAAQGRWEEARGLCHELTARLAEYADSPDRARLLFLARLTCAEADLALGDSALAEEALASALSEARPNPAEFSRATYLRAAALINLGQAPVALELLAPLVPHQNQLLGYLAQSTPPPTEAFALPAAAKKILLLEAEAHAALRQFSDAAVLCELALRHNSGFSEQGRLYAFLRKAAFEAAGNLYTEAEGTLLQAARESRSPELVHQAFAHLLALYLQRDLNPKVSLTPLLSGADPLREPYAEYILAYLAARQAPSEEALRLLETLLEESPLHPLATDARLLVLSLQRRTGATEDPAPALPEDAAQPAVERFHFELALRDMRAGEYALAAGTFAKVADGRGPLALSARYNQALCALSSGQVKLFQSCFEKLSAEPTGAAYTRELQLSLAARDLARGEAKAAREVLNSITARPRAATLLLAELELREGQPSEALRLAQAATEPPAPSTPAGASPATPTGGDLPPPPLPPATPEEREQALYLGFWAQAAQPGTSAETLIERASGYLAIYPGTARSERVRFKLAELFFQQGAYAQAQREFEVLSESAQEPAMQQVAEFQAARCAALSMSERGTQRALDMLGKLAQAEGPLQADALLEMGNLLRENGEYQQGLEAFTQLEEAAGPRQELLLAALQGQAQCLFSMGTTGNLVAGTTVLTPSPATATPDGGSPGSPPPSSTAPAVDEARLRQCLELGQRLASEAGARSHWRNFAMFLQGRCWQELGDTDSALVSFSNIVLNSAGPQAEPEFLWLYRAGFAAVEILEERGQLTTAISVLQRLASLGGPRAPEAAERMKLIRLKNLMWDDPTLDRKTDVE